MQYTLHELAALLGAKLVGDGDKIIRGVECIHKAGAEDATFLENPRYREAIKETNAGVICIGTNEPLIEGKSFLVVDNPSEAFQRVAEAFLSDQHKETGFQDIHPTAVIHPTAKVGIGCHIGPLVVIDENVTIGKGTAIYAHTCIGPNTIIGEKCKIYQRVVIREGCHLGNRVFIQPGAVIGSCGYGYITDKMGQHNKLTHLGNVVLEDDVEIGANTTIDRGRFKETRVKRGSKIDNLVQLGHNVQVGEHNLIVAQTGIAGSTKTGRWVILGGQVGVAGHIEIGDQVIVASKGGVTKTVKNPGKYNGVPLQPLGEFNRHQVQLRRIASFNKRLAALEALLATKTSNK